jgi:hypothetical protein
MISYQQKCVSWGGLCDTVFWTVKQIRNTTSTNNRTYRTTGKKLETDVDRTSSDRITPPHKNKIFKTELN